MKKNSRTRMKYVTLLCVLAILGSTLACNLPFKLVPNTSPEGPPDEEEFSDQSEQPQHEPEMNDEEAIRQALLDELGANESDMDIQFGRMDEHFAIGGATEVNAPAGGGQWLTVHDNGEWVIIHYGQDLPSCYVVDTYNVPPDWVSYCWDEATGSSVKR